MANYQFGEFPGIKEGQSFINRDALREAGIHLAKMAGIDGNPRVGASSIVLNGGYVDDYDLGDEIVYTGHGGNDLNTGRQIKNQSWEATGNKALIVSEMHGLPVRVTRGHRHKSPFSPASGYVYGGLYNVTEHFADKGKDGFVICRFRLQKLMPLSPPFANIKRGMANGSEEPARVATTVLRIIRDTMLSRQIKDLYDYRCQICGIRIEVRGVGYAEAAHIKPLGRPHGGSDKPDNIICLCPNHHVMFDKGAFSIENNLSLIGLSGVLNRHTEHELSVQNLLYHRTKIYIDVKA